MNPNKYQIKFKNILLLCTFLCTAIIASSAAFASNEPEIVANQANEKSLPLQAAPKKAALKKIAPGLTFTRLSANSIRSSIPIANQNQIAQASDVAGNWAEPFIKVLVNKGIIAGYPDGTFRPDQPVNRAEFAALLTKAFDLTPTREVSTFRDVPKKFWGAGVIDKAYRAGFLAGYPNKTFGPTQNILRIESLVSISNGSKLQADGSPSKVDELFTDAAQVPPFGRNALIAATQKCVTVSVSYPDGKTFNPNGVATRADVAAFIHQALVASGKLTALGADSPAQKYIVNCAAAAPVAATITEQDVLSRTAVGTVPGIEAPAVVSKPVNPPVAGVTTPSAFGANGGTFFVGAGYQDLLSPTSLLGVGGTNTNAFGIGAGFGLGNSREFVGLETSYSTSSNGGGPNGGSSRLDLFSRGAVNFKLHKQFGENVAIAAGWENAIRHGYEAGDGTDKPTVYGVVTGVLPVSDTNNFTASVGIGNGRFRQIADIFQPNNNNDTTSIFGSLGFRVSENIGLVADYNGRNFSVGLPLSLKLSDSVGLQLTPAILDVAGDKVAGELTRFGIGGGLGFRF
ncbi:S-layer homology domain-containing protein [Chamaesiphon sp. VAR_48_metabat_135_sub]|uniref:S-layer homology domain-containing protein n=1 Tax=Chamaesiphon sp. VAR_48_metabat_135_sub TaxID=2964699 RepID=UPI00286C3246|nr:S-layer homology domain-containing protein [Chamaesiphon sp. VAR_48_metabat_135_sub]